MAKKPSGTAVLRQYLEDNVGRELSCDELTNVCQPAGLNQWDRVIRHLIQNEGYDIENKPKQWYKLRTLEKKPVVAPRKHISKKLRYLVFERDNFTCQACGRTPSQDNIKLSPDHIIPVEWGGETTLENLQALCRQCNEGKKDWISREDPAIMRTISKQTSAKARLKMYFEAYANEEIPVDRLAVIARTREWTRVLRLLRSEYTMNIKFRPKSKKEERLQDTYVYITEE